MASQNTHKISLSVPQFTVPEATMRSTFLGLMWALSYPGKVYDLPANVAPFEGIIQSLLDLETSYYTPDEHLAASCARTTARAESVERAEYLFFPTVTEGDLTIIEKASIGTMLYPDQAATLIIGGTLSTETTLHLTGPGVQNEASISLAGIPDEFWTLRERTRRFPLGWDIFIVAGNQVIGLPRSTKIN